ncbi:hypothetical protein [Bacillus marinisedimentorum]|uniref:hypothetical protein n=1 Tax=Bacillus marinisedimentorum TaxID=1821260 RepID=UPI001B80BA73|nr:hypothetical protein [Bacillus marinisedimentorum]
MAVFDVTHCWAVFSSVSYLKSVLSAFTGTIPHDSYLYSIGEGMRDTLKTHRIFSSGENSKSFFNVPRSSGSGETQQQG